MLTKMRTLLRSHSIALLLAVVVGVISVAPQARVLIDQNYNGIQMLGTDAEYMYMGTVNRALYEQYAGSVFPNDPGKNYYLAPKLGQRLMALVSWASTVRVVDVDVLLKFFGSTVLFLILYGWLLEVFSSKRLACIAPLFLMLGSNLLSFAATSDTFLPYTRPISPLISSLPLFVGLWMLYHAVYRNESWKNAIVLGIIVGSSLYIYVYTWTFLVVALGLYWLVFLIQKNSEKIKYFSLALIASGIAVVPYALNMIRARSDADYAYSTLRLGLIHTHTPIVSAWVALALVALLFFWPALYKNAKYFFLVLFSALVVVLNEQVLTGIQLQPGHYHWYTTKPLVAILIAFLLLYWMRRLLPNKKLRMAITTLVVLALLSNAIMIQAHSYAANYPTYQANQRYAPVLSFLQRTYANEETIWASPDISALILAYTRHWAPVGLFYPDTYVDSPDHIREMLFLEYRLQGFDARSLYAHMKKDPGEVMGALFGIQYRDLPASKQVTDEELATVAQHYAAFYKKPLKDILKGLHIDLIVEDATVSNLHLSGMPWVSQIPIGDGISVYEVKNN